MDNAIKEANGRMAVGLMTVINHVHNYQDQG